MTYLAVSIPAPDPEKAAAYAAAAQAAGAQMIELRIDYLRQLHPEAVRNLVSALKSNGGVPAVIATCRDQRQGGAGAYPLPLRIEALAAAAEAGADFIDLEFENFTVLEERDRRRFAQGLSSRLILSAHDFQGRFADLAGLYRQIRKACPAAIPKLVYTANHINDCFEAFDLLHQTTGERIVLCMGQAGLISRIIAKKLGGFVTFASIDEQSATAPGQLTVSQMKGLYRYDAVDHDTELFGVIAEPVGHSLSPAIHNACFGRFGMNRLYLPLLVQGAEQGFNEFLHGVLARDWLDFRAFSVTIPHKHSALRFAQDCGGAVEPLAGKIGAANTLTITAAGRVNAYNTDYAGALDAVTAGMGLGRADLAGMAVAIIGAGGVARAIVAGLRDAGARVRIYNRTVEKAERLAREFGCEFAGLDELPGLDARLVVNCTSIGMHPAVDASPLPAGCIKPGMTVFDTVYNPAETRLLAEARDAGAGTIDGIEMFVNQALAQFRLFTGRDGDAGLMRETLCKGLAVGR